MGRHLKSLQVPAIDVSKIPEVVLSKADFDALVLTHLDEIRKAENARAAGTGAAKILLALAKRFPGIAAGLG